MLQDILIVTLGAGRESDLEGTLFTPLRKSVSDGAWSEVILLPSQQTARYAEMFASAMPHVCMRISPLPEPGAEDDVDACYEFFSSVLNQAVKTARGADRVCVDFTRGTKAMSAAAVLAAVTLGIRRLRYVTGERADGTVRPGRELVRTCVADRIGVRMRLEAAWEAAKIGQFAAALALFPDGAPVPDGYVGAVEKLRLTAALYGAWDRFDYARAATHAGVLTGAWGLNQTNREHLVRLARTERMNPIFLRHLTADILANARRRLAWGQPEDALVRVYRASELIGQVRMALRGLDSKSVDPEEPAIKDWLQRPEKSRGSVSSNPRGGLSLGRYNVAHYLKHIGDSMGKPLLSLDNAYGLQAKHRNDSLLAHGFSAMTPGKDQAVSDALRRVESLLKQEDADNSRRLESAQFPWFQPASDPRPI
jgi:CRISPR-associated protein (TIGR02710 family)